LCAPDIVQGHIARGASREFRKRRRIRSGSYFGEPPDSHPNRLGISHAKHSRNQKNTTSPDAPPLTHGLTNGLEDPVRRRRRLRRWRRERGCGGGSVSPTTKHGPRVETGIVLSKNVDSTRGGKCDGEERGLAPLGPRRRLRAAGPFIRTHGILKCQRFVA
jgi:hypothetical protein